ncbi:hypothetical protein W02_22380 [Nitrospira sp. KM1]|uniref:hypothetical protein n=1 Tax=Nitrospira sp. KM1 TaxID=1936990 RepID=UPI0013A72985|nr:hypothetical protein [Nitrospira sp. KM1]BCA55098.1 hypothetical protein W02_22380 [Nitrospira sp. KM1]
MQAMITRFCKRANVSCITGVVIAVAAVAVNVQADQHNFNLQDIRVFKAAACTKDHSPVEALYFIAASAADIGKGKPSPTSKLMKEEVDNNWRQITSRLTRDEVIEEQFADKYNAVLSEMIPRLQQAVEEKSGVSVYVSEVNSRLMDPDDQDLPTCRVEEAL